MAHKWFLEMFRNFMIFYQLFCVFLVILPFFTKNRSKITKRVVTKLAFRLYKNFRRSSYRHSFQPINGEGGYNFGCDCVWGIPTWTGRFRRFAQIGNDYKAGGFLQFFIRFLLLSRSHIRLMFRPGTPSGQDYYCNYCWCISLYIGTRYNIINALEQSIWT